MQFRNFLMQKIFVSEILSGGTAPYQIEVVRSIVEQKFWEWKKANDGITFFNDVIKPITEEGVSLLDVFKDFLVLCVHTFMWQQPFLKNQATGF